MNNKFLLIFLTVAGLNYFQDNLYGIIDRGTLRGRAERNIKRGRMMQRQYNQNHQTIENETNRLQTLRKEFQSACDNMQSNRNAFNRSNKEFWVLHRNDEITELLWGSWMATVYPHLQDIVETIDSIKGMMRKFGS